MELNQELHGELQRTEWDFCVVGNGVSALWLSHWLWSTKKSVLWISSEEAYSPDRAMLQHAWLWGLAPEHAAFMTEQLQGLESASEEMPTFDVAYFDAKSSKRFKKLTEAKAEWGSHEKEFFLQLASRLGADQPMPVDFWAWHSRLHAFHDTGAHYGPTQVELFKEPRFVRVQGWPLIELKTVDGRVTGATLAGMKKGETIEVRAGQFYLGDFDENLSALIKTAADAESLSGALKGKSYRAGFGLRLWHKELASAIQQTAIVPLVVCPEKDSGSHVVGRFESKPTGLESYWFGFLTDDELEDNNEILKKIKQTKRAIERALPGFVESITREAVTFEPRMHAMLLAKRRKRRAVGCSLISDHFGIEAACEAIKSIITGVDGDEQSAPEKKPRAAKGAAKRALEPEVGA